MVARQNTLAQHIRCACPQLRISKLNTPNEPAHNPSGASSQPLVSRLPRGVGLAGLKRLG